MAESITSTSATAPAGNAAENNGGDPKQAVSSATGENAVSTPDTAQAEKTFTQAEVDAIIDKRFAREKAQYEKQLSEKLSEAQRLAKMNAEQKAAYEKEQAEKKLSEREALITMRELKAEAKETLASKGLPCELSECLDYSDAEKCNKSIEAISKAFQSAVSKAVDDKLRQPPPKAGEKNTNKDPFLEGLGVI